MSNQKRDAGRPSADQNEQVKRFVETARALGCDEDEAAFDEKLKAVARQKPTEERKPAKPSGRSKPLG